MRRSAALRVAMTLAEAIEIAGGNLGDPSKMPGRSWGISAYACRRGSELAFVPDSVCSKCYARRGHYITPSVENAHDRRLAALDDPRWVEAMAFLINVQVGVGHFRWFDSGDLQSVEHLVKIAQVCVHTPDTHHWIPTHEHEIVRRYLDRGHRIPGNLVIRLSADMIEDRANPGDLPVHTSTVHRWKGDPVPQSPDGSRGKTVECAAYTRGNRCGTCRACWDPRVANVSYPLH